MKALTLRLDDETYEHLRQEAFDGRTTITDLIRAALAAAGAGTEVGRLSRAALSGLIEGAMERAARDGLNAADEAAEGLMIYLAARGDAATPTEVEWGVRGRGGVVRYPDRRAAVAHSTASQPPVQRTVSAWREVQP